MKWHSEKVILFTLVLVIIQVSHAYRSGSFKAGTIKFKSFTVPSKLFMSYGRESHSHVTSNTNIKQDPFVYLRSLDERCQRLSDLESEFLSSFWSEKLQCFQLLPQLETSRVSVTTTCISLHCILQNPSHWQNRASWKPSSGKISVGNAIQSILDTKWTGDLYQSQQIVQTLASFKACNKEEQKYVAAIQDILANRPKLSNHRDQHISTYLRHQNVRSLLAVVENDMVPSSIRHANDMGFALERANMVAFDELCRQLAFYNCGDSNNFDVMILAYSLLSYWETSDSAFLSSYARGVVPTVNLKLVEDALKVIFVNQADDGTWAKGEPINKIGDAKGNRDIGNNYVFFLDMVGSLLTTIGLKQPGLMAPYLKNLERCIHWAEVNIQQEMLPEKVDMLPERSFGSLITTVKGWRSNHLGTGGGAVAWCTAQVFQALCSLRRVVRQLMTESILNEFSGKLAKTKSVRVDYYAGGGGNDRDWQALMDSDLDISGMKTSLKDVLHRRLLLPQLAKEKAANWVLQNSPGNTLLIPPSSPTSGKAELSTTAAGDRNANSNNIKDTALRAKTMGSNANSNSSPLNQEQFPPLYSVILFGPPGTAKTTICTSIAQFLGWHFLTIDTACFLADGLENIASRMSYVFQRLNALEKTIILFDEIEEFCLDRENPHLTMESRMLTTAMLTQLNDLRRRQQSIFIVATNRLRSFDAAVIRPGRFDMLVFVGTPNAAARLQRLANKLQVKGVFTINQQEQILRTVRQYFAMHWETLRFFTFAENESLLNTIVETAAAAAAAASSLRLQQLTSTTQDNAVSSDAATDNGIDRQDNDDVMLVDDRVLVEKVASLLRTSTIQGAVKVEYEASEKLSRL